MWALFGETKAFEIMFKILSVFFLVKTLKTYGKKIGKQIFICRVEELG
jgi:hypothetical protein